MQFAFSNHARNDWSLEWHSVNKQELETGICFSWKACSRLLKWQPSVQETGNQKRAWMVLTVGALTWFLVCCCALSLLLGCRGASLGMGPIGVGYGKRKGNSKTSLQIKKQKKTHRYTCADDDLCSGEYLQTLHCNVIFISTISDFHFMSLYGGFPWRSWGVRQL